MNGGIAVDFAGAGEQEARTLGFGESKRVVRAERADFERRDRMAQVIDGALPATRNCRYCRSGRRSRRVRDVVRRNVKRGLACRCWTLAGLPVMKLSDRRRHGLRKKAFAKV